MLKVRIRGIKTSSFQRIVLSAIALIVGVGFFAAGNGLDPINRFFGFTAGATSALGPDNAAERLRQAHGGTFRLPPGRYPRLVLNKPGNTERLIIESLDPNRPAIIEGLTVREMNGLTVRNVVFEGTDAMPDGRALVFVQNSSQIALEGLRMSGPAGPQIAQYYGVLIRDSQSVQVRGSLARALRYGVGFLNSQHVTVENNQFHDLQTDGIRGGGASDLLIRGNVIGRFHPEPKDHPDAIQLWTSSDTGPGRRIAIHDNLIVRDGGGKVQGIFIRDTRLQLPFEDLDISGNLVIGSMYNGIAVQGANRLKVTGNGVYALPDIKSWIRVNEARDVHMTQNIANAYVRDGKSQITESDNAISPPVGEDVSGLVRDWLATKPAIKPVGGSYLEALAGKKTPEG